MTISPIESVQAFPSGYQMNYFPLSQGVYWIYEGPVKWTVPGIDVTRYAYVHHGNVAQCDLRLVE